MNETAQPAIGVDIGGTTILSAAVTPDGTIPRHHSRPTPRGRDAEAVWEAVGEAVDAALADTAAAPRGIGIASAGPLDPTAGTVTPVNIPSWRGYPLLRRAQERYPDLPIALEGDGLCMALGESRHGAGKPATAVLGMVVSTGVGGGLVLDGRLYRGPSRNAGHIGHAVARLDGDACPCGSRGCVETVASGPAMVRWARANGWRASERAGARDLAEAARAGDTLARSAFDRAGQALGVAIVNAATLADLDRVVIGGGVAAAGELLFSPIRATIDTYARLDFLRRLEVVPAALGDRAGLLGAAELV